MSGKNKCGHSVSWWEGEYEGVCELTEGHEAPHYDGISCFDDDENKVELVSKPIPPIYLVVNYNKAGKDLNRQHLVINQTNQHLVFQPELDVAITVEVRL